MAPPPTPPLDAVDALASSAAADPWSRHRIWAGRAAVLAIAALLLSRNIAAPFNGWHELNSAMYAQFARNLVRYGVGYTALYCTWGDSAEPPAVKERYLDHPPLIAAWGAVPLLLFGDHEWAFRLVPIAATLGSAALLMLILSRLGSPLLGLLGGFFFAVLPAVAYFGRMLDHLPLVQFFSLLMLHCYLDWSGSYRRPPSRRAGLCYGLSSFLGIATGWAAVVTAGLLWLWQALLVARRKGERRLLVWMTVVPSLALLAVVVHVEAALGWDPAALLVLAGSRSFSGVGGQQPWSAWLSWQATYSLRNFTPLGVLATLVCVPFLVRALRRPACDETSAGFPVSGDLAVAVSLLGCQGLLWVVLLKNQSWFHDYWQILLAPLVATSMAALVVMVGARLAARSPLLALAATVLLLAAPLPFVQSAFAFYASQRLLDPRQIETFLRLRELVPSGAPVWISHRVRASTESFRGRTYKWLHPVVAYYANRPLHFSRSASEIEANAPHCAAAVVQRNGQRWSDDLAAALSRSYEAVPVGDHDVVYLLDRPVATRSRR